MTTTRSSEAEADAEIGTQTESTKPNQSSILRYTDLLFSPSSTPITKVAHAISTSTLSISNRLRSISNDALFIRHVAAVLSLPMVANERCGSWYLQPELKGGSSYFKSTDGHFGQWGFSLRRLNLGVLELAGGRGGSVIIDSTRRGKHLPDALSKTIPIWCAVLNRLLFPTETTSHALVTLPEIISDSEASQITARLPKCVAEAAKLELDLITLREKARKPFKPFWIARGLGLLPDNVNQPRDESIVPIYLCMASEHHESRSILSEAGYVQGAGDDVENWSRGFTPRIFWDNQALLLEASEEELPQLIASFVEQAQTEVQQPKFSTIAQAPWLEVGTCAGHIRTNDPSQLLMVCGSLIQIDMSEASASRVLYINCQDGKVGSRRLRGELEKLNPFLQTKVEAAKSIRICSTSTKDIAIGVALAVFCSLSEAQGRLIPNSQSNKAIDKAAIRKRLNWILTSVPGANPSRATLNSVNSYLMKPS